MPAGIARNIFLFGHLLRCFYVNADSVINDGNFQMGTGKL